MRRLGRRLAGLLPGMALSPACDRRDSLALRPAGETVGVGDRRDRLAVLVARGVVPSLHFGWGAVPCSAGGRGGSRGRRRWSRRCADAMAGRSRANPRQYPRGEVLHGVGVGGSGSGADGDRQCCGDEHGRSRSPPPALPDAPTLIRLIGAPQPLNGGSHVRHSAACGKLDELLSKRRGVEQAHHMSPAGRRVVRCDDAGKDPVCGLRVKLDVRHLIPHIALAPVCVTPDVRGRQPVG